MDADKLSCVDCGRLGCYQKEGGYPDFCITKQWIGTMEEEMKSRYTKDEENNFVSRCSAEIEGQYYCELTRVEEVIQFARQIGAKKLGVATCAGLIKESRTLAKILRHHGFEVCGVICKVGGLPKTMVGVAEEYMAETGPVMCNPIMQAEILNEENTDLNLVVGLCVGHDSLFYKYAKALCTTIVTKDRVLGHNPVAALYTAEGYYKNKLMKKQ